jgi:glycerol kinase
MHNDWRQENPPVLRVDGGMVASDFTMQALADILNAPVDRPQVLETTAVGAAYLAGLQRGIYPPPEQMAKSWKLNRRFEPEMEESTRERKYRGWQDAVNRTLTTR